MKNIIRRVLTLVGLLAIPAAINHLIFALAEKKKRKTCNAFYESRYGDIRYVTAGSGQPLLLIHGVHPGAGIWEWEQSFTSLSRHYKVYALDLLGFGLSEKPDTSYSAYLYITLINDFIREVIQERTLFIGSGNSAAFGVMAYSFEPELFSKMLLVAPTGVGSASRLTRHEDLWVKWLMELPLVGTTVYNIISSRYVVGSFLQNHGFFDKNILTTKITDSMYYSAHFGGSSSRFSMAAYLSKLLNVDITHKLAKLNLPVHVVWGDKNPLNPIDNFAEIKQINPAIDLTVFEQTRLFPHMENPKAFYKVCRDFFKK